MPRKGSEAVPEGNGPVPQQEKIGPGQPTLADVYRMVKELFDKSDRRLEKLTENLKNMNQRVASLEQDARQPRPAMEADGPADTKTRERMEDAAKAIQAKHGDSYTAPRVHDGPKTSTCFGVKAEPSALPYRDNVLVENSAAAPKSCLPPSEMRSPTAVDGLLPTGEASIATRITFNQPPLRLYSTKETNSKKTSTQYASYDSSFWRNCLLAVPSCRRVIETKSGQNRMFDPGGSEGRLRTCPFWGIWRALLCGEVHVRAG